MRIIETTELNKTNQIVREAMKYVSKDVRQPKVIRDLAAAKKAGTIKK